MIQKCPHCGKVCDGRHLALCGKNPNRRGKKKGYKKPQKSNIDKTIEKTNTPLSVADSGLSATTIESQTKLQLSVKSKIKEINLKGEFDKMSEKFESKKMDEDKEKKYKYKCGECGYYFNHPGVNVSGAQCCPDCGK